jgi:MFS family permease
MYGFYSWQKYFLDLLGKDLVWVTGVIAAAVGVTQILGNVLVGRITARVPDRGLILMVCSGVTTVAVIGAALVQQFWVAVPLYLVSTIAFGISMPVKQGWLNSRIPSEQRAPIISLDALFGDGGSTVGQVGLGWLSQTVSIPFAWLIGGLVQGASVPLLGVARRADRAEPVEPAATAPACEPGLEAESPGCFGPEPAGTGVPRGQVAASGGDERVA